LWANGTNATIAADATDGTDTDDWTHHTSGLQSGS
jgi:hypothetical protein